MPASPKTHLRTPKEVIHVYLPPYVADQLGKERQRAKLAQAEQQRQGRQQAALVSASRRAERAERRMRRAARRAVQLRAELQR